MYLIFRYVFPYRKKLIIEQLSTSFPTKSEKEIIEMLHQYYKQFADTIVESVKNMTISQKELTQRFVVKNPEIMHELFERNKSVVLVSGHYYNWEWMISMQNQLFPHQAIGIGMPLSNAFWDKALNERRERYGMQVVHSGNVMNRLQKAQETGELVATLVLSDQSPGEPRKSYWLKFLNRDTGYLFGVEMIANKFDQAVVFYSTKRLKRGYYEIELHLITDSPREKKWGEITEQHAKLLEESIYKNPSGWLWSHNRWKKAMPENLDELKMQQREKFNQMYRFHSTNN